MKPSLALTLLTLIGYSQPGMAQYSLTEAVAADYEANLEELFVHFHANPELSHREFETSERLALELRGIGYDVTDGVGGTGVVAVLRNGNGPTVMVRGDMDGLPIEENSGLSYASTVRQIDIDGIEQPVMHACGHDVHITSLIGTARQMAERIEEWSGTLVLIGQPGEERLSGASAMLEDGLYTRFPKPDYALGFHVGSGLPSGKVVVPLGINGSSIDTVDIVVHGVGTHGAAPHEGIDPVLVASQIVVSLQSIVSRTISPQEPAVITVGSIHGGTKHNIIGDRVELQLTVRADSFETRETLIQGIERVADGVARSLGVPEGLMPEVIRSDNETTPPNINDEETARLLQGVFLNHFGAEDVLQPERSGMAGDDFAYFVEPALGVKGVFFGVGGNPESGIENAPPHHSPFFKIEPESAIRTGVEATVVAAIALMRR